jgi:serine/threonine-protein kinase
MTWTADTTYVTADSTYATADGSGVALGLPVATVIGKLVNEGLIVYPDIEWLRSDTFAYGTVSSITPAAGTQVSPWTVVKITVSLGPTNPAVSSTVPNLIGLQQYYAHQALQTSGLTWINDVYGYSSVVPATYVIAQSIPAGTVVTPGTNVQITVSWGPQPTTPVVIV